MNESEIYAALAELVDCDPETGIIVWLRRDELTRRDRIFNARFAGRECGCIDEYGYRRIGFIHKGKKHKLAAHRLAWVIIHGELPDGEIDHINRNRQDNRIANLRDVPHAINKRNAFMHRNNTSGVTGVALHKATGKWQAQARIDGRQRYVGLFTCIHEAAAAIKVFRSKHGFTDSHGCARNANRN